MNCTHFFSFHLWTLLSSKVCHELPKNSSFPDFSTPPSNAPHSLFATGIHIELNLKLLKCPVTMFELLSLILIYCWIVSQIYCWIVCAYSVCQLQLSIVLIDKVKYLCSGSFRLCVITVCTFLCS